MEQFVAGGLIMRLSDYLRRAGVQGAEFPVTAAPMSDRFEPESGPADGLPVRAARFVLHVVMRSALLFWIIVQILAGFVILPYARLFFHGLERLAVEFPASQRLRVFSEARSRYEAWRRWLTSQSIPVRAAIFSLTVGTAVVLWVTFG